MNSIQLRGIVVAVSGALLLGAAPLALADSTDDIINALMAKGVLTEEEGALLMKGRTGEKEASEAKKASEVKASFKDGLVFESGDKSFSAQINGRVHADYRWFDHDEGQNNAAPAGTTNSIGNVTNVADTNDIRRARIGFKAKYKEYYDVEVVADVANTTTLDVGYLNVAWWKPVQFRFGQFKMPMNLEELTSSNNIDFMERSFVNALAPAKEIGAMVHGSPFKGVTYALAYSNGNAKNAETDVREDDKDIIGRATANFAEMMDNKNMVLHAGVSYSTGDLPQGTAGVAGRTEARGATFFRAPVLANSPTFETIDRNRLGLEGAVAYGPFKVQAEWMKMNNDFETDARSYDLDTKNWYVQALWTITGESYADIYKNGIFGGIKPKNDFDPKTFKGGAWEVGLRYSKFDASDYDTLGIAQGTVDADITTKAAGFAEADAYTVGIKFLPNANMRFMLNYVKTDFEKAIGGSTGGVVVNNERIDDEKALIMRAQWMF